MKFSAYGTNEDSVLNCLKRYQFGTLTEIIESIDFYKGLWKFTFKTPAGFKSWKQWLYLNEQYSTMNDLLKALAKSDEFDLVHSFEDANGVQFAKIDEDKPWKVEYIK